MKKIFFFFNDTATTEIYTLSLHDALPICDQAVERRWCTCGVYQITRSLADAMPAAAAYSRLRDFRSEEHTSELQSLAYLVCRLLLEKKKSDVVMLRQTGNDVWEVYSDSIS